MAEGISNNIPELHLKLVFAHMKHQQKNLFKSSYRVFFTFSTKPQFRM